MWNVTPDECGPYLKARKRQVMFREAVIAFLGADPDALTDEQRQYCTACRAASMDDCDNCDPATIGKL